MMKDFKFLRRNSGKKLNSEETENVPVNVNIRQSPVGRMSTDSCSKPPLNTIKEPLQTPGKLVQESAFKSSKTHRTPTKAKIRYQESGMAMRTPEKQGALARDRFGWGQDSRDEGRIGNVNTPRSCRTTRRASLGFLEPNSTLSTPTKSASKPPNPGLVHGGSSRPPVNGGVRTGNFAALSKGIPVTYNTYTTINTVNVPHFDLREDPSFWMDHNVQVLIRIRPLNGMEIHSQGYNRCLKQESPQCLAWVGHPETRFTFDHVACETIDQETLFKMVGQPMVENCLSGYNSCVFAYGQTGSGKTHTMLGEINDLEVKPSPYRGMTPRIFEFLFARIIAEEGCRKNERLMYNCKCSFLEIYNEQITDLLDPSSTNLQLREDVKKGVYVENLTEFEVHTVGDILRLLSQGSANRRVAATNMNRESSRSHSVFTCVIESRWEKDSTSNLRFARLNLVDLAGSERQKTSGAEGERLKEAANINKSLSTLGHVIMVLVDGANARTRHVPYRDSRLTFLLQDSLGGNSKTMIIANVSPSLSSATETLNTLKFAQRAKLIQNNAVINEDASGDVEALQHQIRLLKEELAILKRQIISRSLTYSSENVEEARQEYENCSNASSLELNLPKFDNYGDDDKLLRVSCKQLKSLETSLNGALRREKSTENSIKQLETEIEQLNSLVRQREEENRCTKMMLKFREDKIQRMESVLAGSMHVDSYFLEENSTLTEEIRVLRAKVDRNPEVTRFAVENIRLLEQLRRFQDFYEEGERELLLTEVSELRDQLVLFLDENSKQDNLMNPSIKDKQENNSLQLELKKSQDELEKCRNNLDSCLEKNEKLCREIADLNSLLEMQKSAVHEQDGGIEVIKESILEAPIICDHSVHTVEQKDENHAKDTKEVLDLQLEVEILKIILKEERSTRGETEEKFLLITKQCENLKEEVQKAKSVIEALEIQQLVSINELEDLNNSNKEYADLLREKELKIAFLNDQNSSQASSDPKSSSNCFKKVQDSLEKAKRLNTLYQTDRACHASNEKEMEEVRMQVEAETSDVIVCLQEEISSLQEKLDVMTESNKNLREKCEDKDEKLYGLSEEIEQVLKAGHMALGDALNHLQPGKRTWVSDQLQIIARNITEKELQIEELNSYLEVAKRKGNEMESMLRSLRGATLVMSEAHQQDCSKKDQEIHQLLSQLSEKNSFITHLEDTIKQKKDQTTAAFVIVKRFSEIKDSLLEAVTQKEGELYKLKDSLHNQEVTIEDAEKEIQSLKIESCCYLDKLVEADLMINQLVNQNEAMKNEMEELKKKVVTLMTEKESYSILEEQLKKGTMEMKKEVEEVESMILEIQATVDEDLIPMASDFFDIKSTFHDSVKLMLTWHEEIWSEIIAKDWAVSVLHVCHMGILIETVTGINAEKGLLYHGLCESNSLVSELREQNGKSRKELESCSMLRGKLLVDIKNSFDRITRKEEETGKLSIKVTGFEKKILDLQVMEEAMLERSSRMGHELSILMKEMDNGCRNQEAINEKDEELGYLEEKIIMDSSAKEIELFIMLSKLEQVISENYDLEKEKSSIFMVLEKFKEEQRHKIEEFEASFEALECELYESVVKGHVFEAQLKEKVALISTLEADLFRECEAVKSLSYKIKLLTQDVEDALKAKDLAEQLKMLETALDEKNTLIESLKGDLKNVTCERDDIHGKLLRARKEVEMTQALVVEHEEIATKAKQAVETSMHYVKEKEEELKLYEKSVEELECTVNVLENQVDMVKEDAERQRLQKDELELELHDLKQQIHSVKTSDSDMQRQLDEKERELQDVFRRIIILEKEIASKNLEIAQQKDHIVELNLQYNNHAMGDQVNSPLKRLDRSGSRSRGPGSPFKCIALGLQMESEKDKELISAKVHIEKLEAEVKKLRKSEAMVNQVKEELLSLRAAGGRDPC